MKRHLAMLVVVLCWTTTAVAAPPRGEIRWIRSKKSKTQKSYKVYGQFGTFTLGLGRRTSTKRRLKQRAKDLGVKLKLTPVFSLKSTDYYVSFEGRNKDAVKQLKAELPKASRKYQSAKTKDIEIISAKLTLGAGNRMQTRRILKKKAEGLGIKLNLSPTNVGPKETTYKIEAKGDYKPNLKAFEKYVNAYIEGEPLPVFKGPF